MNLAPSLPKNEKRRDVMTELPHPRNSAKLNPPDSILRGGARKRAQFSASAFGLCRKRRRADFAPTTWLGWQDSNLQYQSQSLVCYRYTTSHHRLRQRGRHCRPPASSGVGDGARTHDTRNHNPVLIPTELHPPLYGACQWHARRDSNPRPTA